MSTETRRVIVVDGLYSQCCVPTKEAHHLNFPEIRAECSSTMEAVARLAHQLEAYRDGAQSTWHRETIESALVDIQEFIRTLAQIQADGDPACCREHGETGGFGLPVGERMSGKFADERGIAGLSRGRDEGRPQFPQGDR